MPDRFSGAVGDRFDPLSHSGSSSIDDSLETAELGRAFGDLGETANSFLQFLCNPQYFPNLTVLSHLNFVLLFIHIHPNTGPAPLFDSACLFEGNGVDTTLGLCNISAASFTGEADRFSGAVGDHSFLQFL
jgi:hypothetical protein